MAPATHHEQGMPLSSSTVWKHVSWSVTLLHADTSTLLDEEEDLRRNVVDDEEASWADATPRERMAANVNFMFVGQEIYLRVLQRDFETTIVL